MTGSRGSMARLLCKHPILSPARARKELHPKSFCRGFDCVSGNPRMLGCRNTNLTGRHPTSAGREAAPQEWDPEPTQCQRTDGSDCGFFMRRTRQSLRPSKRGAHAPPLGRCPHRCLRTLNDTTSLGSLTGRAPDGFFRGRPRP